MGICVDALAAEEATGGKRDLEVDVQLLEGAVPALDAPQAVLHVLLAEHLVHRVAKRNALVDQGGMDSEGES